MKGIKICILVILLMLSIQINARRPKVAIYANVYPDEKPSNSYVYSNNALYLNSIGVDVFVIFAYDSEQYIDYVISNVDGIYFQGGDVNITSPTMFYRTYNYILNRVKDLNDRNIKKVALWHTCMGYEIFVNAINKSDVLENYDSSNWLTNLVFEDSEIKKSKMFAHMNDDILKAIKENKIIHESHSWGFNRKTLDNYILKDFFQVTSYSFDKKDKEYVGSIEAKNYPFFGTQFHPEKTIYQRKAEDNVSHSFEAIQFTKQLGFNFVNHSRKSYENTSFEDNVKERNFKTYCYLKIYKNEDITDQNVLNQYFSMILGDNDIANEYSKFSLRKIDINKFDYTTTEDGSTLIVYAR